MLLWLYLLKKARGVVVFVQFISANPAGGAAFVPTRVGGSTVLPDSVLDRHHGGSVVPRRNGYITVCKGRVGMKRIGVFHETDAKAGGVVLRR